MGTIRLMVNYANEAVKRWKGGQIMQMRWDFVGTDLPSPAGHVLVDKFRIDVMKSGEQVILHPADAAIQQSGRNGGSDARRRRRRHLRRRPQRRQRHHPRKKMKYANTQNK